MDNQPPVRDRGGNGQSRAAGFDLDTVKLNSRHPQAVKMHHGGGTRRHG